MRLSSHLYFLVCVFSIYIQQTLCFTANPLLVKAWSDSRQFQSTPLYFDSLSMHRKGTLISASAIDQSEVLPVSLETCTNFYKSLDSGNILIPNRIIVCWPQEELDLLISMRKNEIDWDTIATTIGRSRSACFQKYYAAVKKNGIWTSQLDYKLLDAIAKYGEDWSKIASLLDIVADVRLLSF